MFADYLQEVCAILRRNGDLDGDLVGLAAHGDARVIVGLIHDPVPVGVLLLDLWIVALHFAHSKVLPELPANVIDIHGGVTAIGMREIVQFGQQ